MHRRQIFQGITVLLVAGSVWTAYANVLSEDTEVRAKARATVNNAAACGEACKLEGLRGDRGMLETRIEYDIVNHGHYVVVCRRAFIVAGDYACEVREGKPSSGSDTPAPATKQSAPAH